MGKRLTKITTKTGDNGTTAIADGTRLAKHHLRICAIGDIDELNAHLGLLLSEPLADPLPSELNKIQHDLFDAGAELCMPPHSFFPEQSVARLEQLTQEFNQDLPPLNEFILPGGSRAAALAHVTRTVARRAERSLTLLHDSEPLNPTLLIYMNRLSDLLFVWSRWILLKANLPEVQWKKGFNQSTH